MSKPRLVGIRWRWILPIGQLLVGIVVMGPVALVLLLKIHESISAYSGSAATKTSQQQHYLILQQDTSPEEERRIRNFERRLWTPASLNFPAGALSIPYEMFSSTHEEWHPRGMDFRYWRDLSWPLVGIVFWWSAGKCIEGLIQSRRSIRLQLSWLHPIMGVWEIITGTLLYALAISFGTSLQGDPPPEIVAGGGIVWFALGITTITGFWLQRRMLRVRYAPTLPQP